MKEFFKNKFNLSVVILYGIGLISMALVVLHTIFYLIFGLSLSVATIMTTYNIIAKSKLDKKNKPENVINAGLQDYDEEIYVVEKNENNKNLAKNLLTDKRSLIFLFVFLSIISVSVFISGILMLI